jgi:cysteine desulfurase/selenocysteine lyase
MSTLWDEVRHDFPGLAGQSYLNAAATSITPRPVREAVLTFYRELETGGDFHWDAWLERRESVRHKVARFIGAEAGRCSRTSSSSRPSRCRSSTGACPSVS